MAMTDVLKKVGGAVKKGVETYEKGMDSDSDDGKNSGSTGRKIGTAIRGGIQKLRGKPKAKGGPKQPTSLKGIF